MNKTRIVFLLLIAVSASLLLVYPNKADAVALTLKRVIFEEGKRAEVVTIINNGEYAETYRIGWKNIVMSKEGGLKSLPKGTEVDNPVARMIRFSPRRFTLPPGGSQQVRMMLRMPSGTEDGEYRSHLYVRPEANVEAIKDQINKESKGKSGAFMKMLTGVSMPIFVRKGNLTVDIEFGDIKAIESANEIAVEYELLRSGTKSSYGDIDYICNKGAGDEYLIKFTRGLSLYLEVDSRIIRHKLNKKADKPACRDVTVRYTETDGFVGKMISVLAEKTIPVQ